jgi:hypothetical protein
MSSGRYRLGLTGVVVGAGVWLASAGSAAALGTITVTCDSPGRAGPCAGEWYTSPVAVTWHVDPAPQSTSGCISKTYTDTISTLSCGAGWSDGSTASTSFRLSVESSPPTVTATPARASDSNGWYRQPVAVTFKGTAISGPVTCAPATATYNGPDSRMATVSSTCTDPLGKSSLASLALSYDATPPTVSVKPSRRPDHHGWYNHPVAFSFRGTDATSGLAGCTNTTYAGPDSATAAAIGSCTDQAGNVATLSVPLRYDATPPCLSANTTPGDGLVFVHWHGCVRMKIVRSPGLGRKKPSVVERGNGGTFKDTRVRNGIRYSYTITGEDQAGNVATATVTVVPGPRLLSPAPNAHLTAPPVLSWTAKLGATYYNVQLYRGRRRILNAWPAHAIFGLPSTWTFAHHHYRLKPGVYRWYIWPGIGPRSADRYGPAIGSGTFVIVSPGV